MSTVAIVAVAVVAVALFPAALRVVGSLANAVFVADGHPSGCLPLLGYFAIAGSVFLALWLQRSLSNPWDAAAIAYAFLSAAALLVTSQRWERREAARKARRASEAAHERALPPDSRT